MTTDLKFLTSNIEEQQRLSDVSLNQARHIDALLTNPSSANWPPEALAELRQARDRFLNLAEQLSTAATVTAGSAVIFIQGANK
jgi:hypothetical protein